MFPSMIRAAVPVLLLTAIIAVPASGQEFILPYLKTPETPAEFWAALKYERHLGNYKRAAQMLAGMWKQVETLDDTARKKFLLELYDNEKFSTFLQLDRIPELDAAKAKDKAGKDVRVTRLIIEEMEKYVDERIGNPERIKQFIKNLSSKVKEERDYALQQLRLSGYRAVPYMLEAYRDKNRDKEHINIYNAWAKMDKDIAPPLYAALATTDDFIRSQLIRLFLDRGDDRTTREGLMPHLWYWHGKGDPNATDALTKFLSNTATPLPKEKLADTRAVLTADAEAYYKHLVAFPPNVKLLIWEFDEKDGVKSRTATPSQMEEYFGTFWAKRALDLDPKYEPAQIILVSLLIEKATEKGGIDESLAKLLGSLDTVLIEKALARAMAEKRDAVARGALRVLLPLGEKRLVRNTGGEPPPLVRALKYPDRQVQLLAADTIIRIPATDSFAENSRIVKLLGRALASEPGPKAIIAMADQQDGKGLEGTARNWGYATKSTNQTAELFKLAAESADVELIILDAAIGDPGLLQVLSQLRASPDTAGIPVLILGNDKVAAKTLMEAAKYDRVRIVSPRPVGEAMLKAEHDQFFADLAKRFSVMLTNDERKAQSAQAQELLLFLAATDKKGYDLRPLDELFYGLLNRDDTAANVAEILAIRQGAKGNESKTQEALAHLASAMGRPKEIRIGAINSLRTHMQRWGILIGQNQLNELIRMPETINDPNLKQEATRLAVLLKPDSKLSGDRLKDFKPAPPMPPPMPEEKPKP